MKSVVEDLNRHLILCKSTCLIRADNVNTPQCLYCKKSLYYGIALRHLRHTDRKDDGNYSRKSLGDSSDRKRYGRHKSIHDSLLLNEDINKEYDDTYDDTYYGKYLAQCIKALLKGCCLILYAGKLIRDLTELGIAACAYNYTLCTSVCNSRTHEEHILTVTDGAVLIKDSLGILIDGN